MIQANDLRIGDLVNYHDDDIVFQVTEISKLGIGVKNDTEETWIEYDRFSPIKLTPELLEKCGFEKEGLIRRDYKTTSGELVDLIYYGKLK